MKLKGIFLDFDGVISSNSVGLMHKWVYEYICKKIPVPVGERTVREIAKMTTTFPPRAVLDFMFSSFGLEIDVTELQQLMHKEISGAVVIDPSFSKLVHFCTENNIELKIISQRSSSSGSAFNQLAQVPGLNSSMVCSTQGMSKADPACYVQIGNNLEINLSDWLLVDDSPYALRAAKIAGLNTALMVTPTFNMDDYLEYKQLIDLRLMSLEDLIQTEYYANIVCSGAAHK
ncbi:MAG TPA: HAD hydrolase-like protein [Leptolyngbyaceae cyanobacterium]